METKSSTAASLTHIIVKTIDKRQPNTDLDDVTAVKGLKSGLFLRPGAKR